ncbi:hypothetical protein GCM10022226_03160 [Sphaerisporangium flaviroseum]|uniref:Uncharacterized protein n=1 Tax=Sphaerisporangium flaviroseum TaxID=509199 RepID=A0ABP7HBI9_9ACTN
MHRTIWGVGAQRPTGVREGLRVTSQTANYPSDAFVTRKPSATAYNGHTSENRSNQINA